MTPYRGRALLDRGQRDVDLHEERAAMGMFATFTYADHRWLAEEDPVQRDGAPSGPFFSATVHDSDFATLRYEPASTAGGLAYLGFQPRDYFDDPSASDDVDLDAQATGLAEWAAAVTGTAVSAGAIRPLLAQEFVEEPIADFVEDTLQRLVSLLGLPLIAELIDG
jgi:hypothetical protein